MTEKFTISNLPMPPSSNHCYEAMAVRGGHSHKTGERLYFGKMRPSQQLTDYQAAFTKWALVNNVLLAKCRKFIRDEILFKQKMIQIDTYSCFHGTKLWNQKGLPKIMDGTNRIKALHDCLALALQVDDSFFWQGKFEKVETKKPEPWCFVVLRPWEPRGVSEIKTEDL